MSQKLCYQRNRFFRSLVCVTTLGPAGKGPMIEILIKFSESFWPLKMSRSEQGYFLKFWIFAGARQAICQRHAVRHSYMGSEPGLQVPRVLASCDCVMWASGREGGPHSDWNVISAISAVSTRANAEFILLSSTSRAVKVLLVRTTSYCQHLRLNILVIQSRVSFSYSKGCSNNNTISFAMIKFFFLPKRKSYITCQSF